MIIKGIVAISKTKSIGRVLANAPLKIVKKNNCPRCDKNLKCIGTKLK